MKLKDLSGNARAAELTTDHSASSYGQPVLVIEDGQAHGWFDVVGWSIIEASHDERDRLERSGYFMQDVQETE